MYLFIVCLFVSLNLNKIKQNNTVCTTETFCSCIVMLLHNCTAILPICLIPEEPELRNSLLHSHSPGSSTDILFPGNGATCRSVQGPIRTVSEGNAKRAGGDEGGWWCWASVTGTSIRALSFPPVLLSATGTHKSRARVQAGAPTHVRKYFLCDLSEWSLS